MENPYALEAQALIIKRTCRNPSQVLSLSIVKIHIVALRYLLAASSITSVPCHQFPLEASCELFPLGSSSPPSFLNYSFTKYIVQLP